MLANRKPNNSTNTIATTMTVANRASNLTSKDLLNHEGGEGADKGARRVRSSKSDAHNEQASTAMEPSDPTDHSTNGRRMKKRKKEKSRGIFVCNFAGQKKGTEKIHDGYAALLLLLTLMWGIPDQMPYSELHLNPRSDHRAQSLIGDSGFKAGSFDSILT
jgi:hypothetical protein